METKTCTKCKKSKPIDRFPKNGKENGVQQHRASCKDCDNSGRHATRRKNHPDYMKRWAEANTDHLREYRRDWRQSNPEYHVRHREQNKDVYAEYHRKWSAENPNKRREHRQKYRTSKRNLHWHVVPDSYLVSRDGMICGWCSKDLPEDLSGVHRDHIVPLSHGGPHTYDNLTLACGLCNLRKKDKDPLEFSTVDDVYPSTFILRRLDLVRLSRIDMSHTY